MAMPPPSLFHAPTSGRKEAARSEKKRKSARQNKPVPHIWGPYFAWGEDQSAKRFSLFYCLATIVNRFYPFSPTDKEMQQSATFEVIASVMNNELSQELATPGAAVTGTSARRSWRDMLQLYA
mmetsp:Transcript_9693/g.26034  ORF Transcript_9693/g.26034 Transcript_9693/m.26034 type:complete len:123 (-) Transcript_9693:420-788(-)